MGIGDSSRSFLLAGVSKPRRRLWADLAWHLGDVRPRTDVLEAVVALAILTLALFLRADGLMLLPRLTDETQEVELGLRVARGETWPLVGVAPHIGALFTYLVAGTFRVLGPTVDVGRLVVVAVGTLTIIPTYLLGRELGFDGSRRVERARAVGLLAALLLTVSGPHIMVSSRIAYSNSLTPFFTTATIWLLHRALARRSDVALVGSGLGFGLAVQTHVSALALAPGLVAAIACCWCRGSNTNVAQAMWPRLSALMLTIAAALLMIANVIVFNVLHHFASSDAVSNRVDRYLGSDPWTLPAWGDRMLALARGIALAVAGQVSDLAWPVDRLASPFVVVPVALALLGIWACCRRGIWLPLLATLSVFLVVSALNGRVEAIVPRVRHYASLIPLGAVVIAEGLACLYSVIGRLLYRDWLAGVGLAAATSLVVVGSVTSLHAYESERLSRLDKNNSALLGVLDGITTSGTPEDRVYVDDELANVFTFSGGRTLDHLRFAFDVVGQEYDVIDVERDSLPLGRSGPRSKRLLLTSDDVEPALQRYQLEPLPGDPGDGAALRAFRASRR